MARMASVFRVSYESCVSGGDGERVGCGDHELTVPAGAGARQGVPVYEGIRWLYESG
jgi:hypothetical protein